jgi:L-asparaginase II
MSNPILVELTRGSRLESAHTGALALARADGEVVCAVGDIARPIYPRSAIKPLQAIAFVESGAAERFAFGAAEIALCCGSHGGTPRHVGVASAMLTQAGLTPLALACGVHEPLDPAAARELVRSGVSPSALHHNCSGKHAGMLAAAMHIGAPARDYWLPEHPVQQRVKAALEDMAEIALGPDACGIDGCSVPNWAMPLGSLARAFAKFVRRDGTGPPRSRACRRIAEACWTHPDLVASAGRLDTRLMQELAPKVLLKSGAEGVYCGALPEHGLGFALKIDDGAKRGAELAVVEVIARFYPAARALGPERRLRNWRGIETGETRIAPGLAGALASCTDWRIEIGD